MRDKKKRGRVSVIFPPSHASSAMHRYIMQKKQLRYCFLWTRWPPRAFYFLFSMPEKPDNFSLILTYLSVCLLPYGFQNKCILFISPLLVFERISAHHSKTSEAFLGDYAIFIARHDFPRKTMSAILTTRTTNETDTKNSMHTHTGMKIFPSIRWGQTFII